MNFQNIKKIRKRLAEKRKESDFLEFIYCIMQKSREGFGEYFCKVYLFILQYYQHFTMNNYQNNVHNACLFNPRLVILIVVILSQVDPVHSCYSFKSGSQQCEICQAQNDFSCTYTNSSNGGIKANQSVCLSYCCNNNIFVDASSCPFCQYHSSQNESSLANKIIIAVFSSLVFVSLIVSLRACYKNISAQRQKDKEQQLAKAAKLAAYKIEDIGPLYQDKAQTCSICLENDCNTKTRCGHSYHSQCLFDWVGKQEKCPLCISVQFNPIVLYCKKCCRRYKMEIITNKLSEKQKETWEKFSQYSCDECDKSNLSLRDSIYIDKKESSAITTQKIDSQARVL